MKKIVLIALICIAPFLVAGYRINPTANASGEAPGITDERQAVIDGRMFIATDSFQASSRVYIFQTGSKIPRISISLLAATTGTYATNVVTFAWSESLLLTTTTGGTIGTAITRYNVNRQSTTTATGSVTHSPSAISTIGTSFPDKVFNLSNLTFPPCRTYQFDPLCESGWLLKPDTKYWLRITPSSITSSVQVNFRWKE